MASREVIFTRDAMRVHDRAALSVLAYGLLIAATVPLIARCQGTWGVLPLWLLLAAYAVRCAQAVAPADVKARYADAARLLLVTYFVVKVVWPFDMYWFDALAALALVLEPGDPLAQALLVAYYTLGAVTYAGQADRAMTAVLQTAGRTILAALTGSALLGA